MDHRITHLDTGRIAVEQDAPDLLFQQRRQLRERLEVRRLADDRRRELPVQTVQCGTELRLIGHLDNHRGWAEDFFLQHFIAVDQQADIRFEQLRLRLIALLRIAGQMFDALVREQLLQAVAVTAKGAGIEHGLRRLVADQPCNLLHECAELWRANTDDQTRIGAELTAALHDRRGEVASDAFRASGQRLRQDDDRVDARHLGKHRDWLRACRSHVAQRTSALERTGETDSLNRRMLDQPLADATAIDHVEHTRWHLGFFRRANQCISHQLGRGHVTAVRLEHHRATGSECRCGVATGSRKRQRKIARAEHGDWTEADAVLTQIRARQWLAIRQRQVDPRAVEIATAQHFGEQTHLAAGATAFALNAPSRQRGFAADHGDEIITERVQFVGNRVEKLRTTLSAEAAIGRVGGSGGFGGGVNFFGRGLDEIVRQLFARRRVNALQFDVAGSATLTADVVVTENLSHGISLKGADAVRFENGLNRGDAIDQRCAEFGLADFENVTRLGANAIGERQGRGAEKVNVHVARAQKLAVLEVVVFEVRQAVAHVGLATEELVLPQHFTVTQDAAGARKVLG